MHQLLCVYLCINVCMIVYVCMYVYVCVCVCRGEGGEGEGSLQGSNNRIMIKVSDHAGIPWGRST